MKRRNKETWQRDLRKQKEEEKWSSGLYPYLWVLPFAGFVFLTQIIAAIV